VRNRWWTAGVVTVLLAAGAGCAHRQTVPLALQAFSVGQGSPLVMIGGGTRGAAEFLPHAQVLAKEFRVVRLQTLNVARSEKREALPEPYSIKVESAAMAASLDRLGLTGPIDLVGHSFGALVALDFALDHPDRVHTLTLAEPPAFWVVPPDELRASPDMWRMYELTRAFVPSAEPTEEQIVQFRCLLGDCGIKVPDRADPGWEDWERRRAALRGLAAVPNHRDDPSRLRQFRRPVLIMTGSTTVPFHRRIDDILANSLPMAETEELTGGHGAPAAARDEFIAKLRAFIARHEGSRGISSAARPSCRSAHLLPGTWPAYPKSPLSPRVAKIWSGSPGDTHPRSRRTRSWP